MNQVCQAARKENIECIVAPFEADAQLAYLARKGHVAACVTEDSDLLTFGTPTVLFKMDKCGSGILMESSKILGHKKGSLGLRNVGEMRFMEICILAGCDYLPSIPGFGFKKAMAELSRSKTVSRVCSIRPYVRVLVSITNVRIPF